MAKRPKANSAMAAPPPPSSVPRPIPLSSVIGQDRAIAVLNDALSSGRVHHAWIFHGPQGVGKFTAALAFAGVLLDPTSQAGFSGQIEPDPDSHVQRLLGAGSHPDLYIITKELARYHEDSQIRSRKQTTIPVDVLRDFMLDPGRLAPRFRSESRAGKVFIIDEAELLAAAGQNVLLKFLEEPPDRTVVILVTSSEERLLPTIRSRAQRVFFAPLGEKNMAQWLKVHKTELPAAERDWLVRFADGSPGVFELAHTTGLFAWWERLRPMLDSAFKGGYSVEIGASMAELVEQWAKAWVESHDNASKEAANKAGVDWMLRLLSAELRGRLRSVVAKNADAAGPYLVAIDALRQSESEIDANVSIAFVMDKVASELSAAFAPAGAV